MSGWLASGLRRDICIVVSGLNAPSDRDVKREIERRYGSSVRPRRFYGALEELQREGHLTKRTEGIHDRFALSEAGERALRTHFDWFAERVE